ncbi:MAG: hypothetical protein H6577_19620 [Lewinellaceae bacterium]|nr:hypothetical protein [Saprospiraceae bacterium]MCB9340337.1 hypothetical protein [Lewinellaceae bacterium]
MHPSSIRTMDQLRQKQDRLQIQMELTKQEFFKSANHTTVLGKDLLLKRVLVPAGAVALGAMAAKKIFAKPADGEQDQGIATDPPTSSNHWLSSIMLVAMPFIQQLFSTSKTTEEWNGSAASKGDGSHLSYQQGSSPTGILAKVVPLAIPFLQEYFALKAQQHEKQVTEKRLTEDGVRYADVTEKKKTPGPVFIWLFQLLPVLLPLIQQHFSAQKMEERPAESNPQFAGQ